MNPTLNAADIAVTLAKISVFLVEDSALIRNRLLSMLADMPGVEVVGHADNAADAIDGILAAPPRAVVLDIQLKNGSGIDVLRAVKPRLPAVVMIVLTNYATPEYRKPCLALGAEHFLDKTNEFQSIRTILAELRTVSH
jgi:DNA-binding NarL/FixJ family response regulator